MALAGRGVADKGCASFDDDLSQWDTSKVTNLVGMFANYFSFNGDLSEWDTSNVTEMQLMFYCCNSLFTRPLHWKTRIPDVPETDDDDNDESGSEEFSGEESNF